MKIPPADYHVVRQAVKDLATDLLLLCGLLVGIFVVLIGLSVLIHILAAA